MPFRNGDDYLLLRSFTRKVFRELLPERSSVSAHDAVLSGIKSRRSLKNMNPDVLFGGFFRSIPERTIRDVEKELPQAQGGLEAPARHCPFH